ncbi:hypothetical protein GE061_011842 [Apolygus lucorum]|uniref:Uncharacterized protein n=1 Tax=Apolygus lucorum TaxID=248454 RepID=A0A8S9Y0M7_APOLU|nr:hypothetical protein GE061_011842 [Apolygus lucorum]
MPPDTERAERSRVHERGTSAERRYKRSHRRSPTSRRRHRHHRRRSSKHKDSYDSRSPTAELPAFNRREKGFGDHSDDQCTIRRLQHSPLTRPLKCQLPAFNRRGNGLGAHSADQ